MSAWSWDKNAARKTNALYAKVSVLFSAGSESSLSNSASVSLTHGLPVAEDFPLSPKVYRINETSGLTLTSFRLHSSQPNLITRLRIAESRPEH